MSLSKEVQSGIAARRNDWPRIAADTGISVSWLKKFASGKYASRPIHETLEKAAKWLRRNPVTRGKHVRSVRNRT